MSPRLLPNFYIYIIYRIKIIYIFTLIYYFIWLIGYASRAMLHLRVVSLTFYPAQILGYDFGHWKSPSKVNKVDGLLLWHHLYLTSELRIYILWKYLHRVWFEKIGLSLRHFLNWSIFKIEQGENLEFWGQESWRTLFNSIRRLKQVLERVLEVSFNGPKNLKWS